MDMNRFKDAYGRVSSRQNFSSVDISEKLVVRNSHTIRIIGDFESAWEHFVPVEGGQYRPVYCDGPNSDCPICKYAAELALSDNEEDKKFAESLRASERFYFNVLDRSEEGKIWHQVHKKTKILTQNEKGANIGGMLFQAIGAVCNMLEAQGQDPDPNNFDIFVQRTGKNLSTRYSASYSGIRTPLTEEEKAYEQHDLKALARRTSSMEVEAIFNYLKHGTPLVDTTFNPEQYEKENAGQPSVPVPDGVQPAQEQQHIPPTSNEPKSDSYTTDQNTVPNAVPPPPPPPPSPEKPVEPPPTLQPPAQPAPAIPQKSKPTDDFDPSKHYKVPCSNCGAEMMIVLNDPENIICWKCGKEFRSPWAKK